MPAPLSDDIRERVVALYALSGATYEYVAESLEIGRASVARVLRLQRENGTVQPLPATGGPARMLTAADEAALVKLVEAKPDATLDELVESWRRARPDRPVSRGTISRRLREHGYTFKKKRFDRRKWTRSE